MLKSASYCFRSEEDLLQIPNASKYRASHSQGQPHQRKNRHLGVRNVHQCAIASIKFVSE